MEPEPANRTRGPRRGLQGRCNHVARDGSRAISVPSVELRGVGQSECVTASTQPTQHVECPSASAGVLRRRVGAFVLRGRTAMSKSLAEMTGEEVARTVERQFTLMSERLAGLRQELELETCG